MKLIFKMCPVIVLAVVVVSLRGICDQQIVKTDFAEAACALPCWNQSWKSGKWVTMQTEPDSNDAIFLRTEEAETLSLSVCSWCRSIRVVDCENRTERIIVNPRALHRVCKHKWKAALMKSAGEPIKPGDVLLIVYASKMYALRLEEILDLFEQQISYSVAEVPESWQITHRIDLSSLTWKKRRATSEIELADRTIDFGLHTEDDVYVEGDVSRVLMTVVYDHYFDQFPGPEAIPYEDSAHIAIVHRADLGENSLIDLAEFRFKTWEDGLGNRCDKVASHSLQTPVVEVTYLSLHDGVVKDIVVAPDGSYLVSTGNDRSIVIQDLDFSLKKILSMPVGKAAVSTMTVSHDGATILAGGPYELGGIFKIGASDAKYRMIELPLDGSIASISYCHNGEKIAYITAANKLCFFDFELYEPIGSHDVFGGFLGDIAVSHDGRFFAVISMNEVKRESAEPCRLTIFDQQGNKTLAHQFEDCRASFLAKMAFLTEDCLALCLPVGEMWKWKWSPEKSQWTVEEKLRIESGRFSAVERSQDGKMLWLSVGKKLMTIDTATGKTVDEQEFNIGESKSKSWVQPITVIKIVPAKGLLALGFQDGRIALVPIPKTLVSDLPD